MNLDHLYPYGFRSTLFDRLVPEQEDFLRGMSIQQLRESVARDLEDLLNSRIAQFDRNMDEFPLAKNRFCSLGSLTLLACLPPTHSIETRFVSRSNSLLQRMNQDCDRSKLRCSWTVIIWDHCV